MPRGRKPKPTQLKRLGGNPGKRKLNAGEPQPKVIAPPTPRGERQTARSFYSRYAPMLANLMMLTEADWAAFHLMAMHYGIALDAAREIKHNKMTQIDFNGIMRKHPLLSVFRDNSIAFLRYAVEFGMTPSSRSRIDLGGDKDIDPFEEFVRQKLGDPA